MRVRRSLLNFATSVGFLVVTMLVGLRSTPLLLGWLGDARWGGQRVLLAGYGFLGLLELGLGGALGPLLARAVGRGDADALAATMAAGARSYLRVAALAIVLGLAATPLVPAFAHGLDADQRHDLRLGWLIGLASFGTLALLPLRTVIEARQQGYLVNLLMTGQSLLITGLSLALAWAGWGIRGQSLAQVVGVWTFSLTLAVVAVGDPRPWLGRAWRTPVDPAVQGALRALSLPNVILDVCGRISVLADDLLISRLIGIGRVSSFSNTQRLPTIGLGVLQAVGGASWAALAELHAQGERTTIQRRLVEMTRATAVLGVIGLVPVLAYNRAFCRLWLGADFTYGGDALTALACGNAVLLAVLSLWSWALAAVGEVRRVVPSAVVAAVVNVSLSVILTLRLGLVGPLLGSLSGFVLVGLATIPRALRQIFGVSILSLLAALIRPLAVGAVAAMALRATMPGGEPAGWAGLIVRLVLAALAMLGLSLAVLLDGEDRALWRARLASWRRRREDQVPA